MRAVKFSNHQKTMMPPNKNAQSGSAIIYVLIGIALMGMLYFVFARSSTSTQTIGTKGTAKTIALGILEQSNMIARRVEKLQAKGCADSQLQFNWPTNPSAPSDKSCDVYATSGNGGIIKPTPPLGYDDPSALALWVGPYAVQGNVSIPNQGSGSCDELFISLWQVRQDVCLEINKELGIDHIPDAISFWSASTPSPDSACAIWADWSALVGTEPAFYKTQMCFKYGSNGNIFVRMVIPR